jgi:hypothetical protein
MQLPVWNLLEAISCVCQDVFPCGNEDKGCERRSGEPLSESPLRATDIVGPPYLLDISQSCGVVDPPEDVALTRRLGEDAVQEDLQNSTLQNIDMKVSGCAVPVALVKEPLEPYAVVDFGCVSLDLELAGFWRQIPQGGEGWSGVRLMIQLRSLLAWELRITVF